MQYRHLFLDFTPTALKTNPWTLGAKTLPAARNNQITNAILEISYMTPGLTCKAPLRVKCSGYYFLALKNIFPT